MIETLISPREKQKPANYFFAEWIPTGMKQSEYNRLQVGQPVQILHPITNTFVEPIQFVSRNENGNIRIKSLDEVGVAREYFPYEYRPVRLVILQRVRKVHFDMLPANRSIAVPYSSYTEYYEIRAEVDEAEDERLVNKSQHLLVNRFLTDLEIFLDCGQPDWSHNGARDLRSVLVSHLLEEEIFREYPSLKDVKHPNPDYLLLHEPFYGINVNGNVELFDGLENYMGYMQLSDGKYVPAEFAGLVQRMKMDVITSVRVRNIEFFIDGKHSGRRKNIE